MLRRVFLQWLALAGVGRRAWAQDVRYAALSKPVAIPLEDLGVAWRPVRFTAEATAPGAPRARRRVLISGVLFRRPARDTPAQTPADQFSALCLTCPHEQCVVDLITDPAQLIKMTGSQTQHPLFECGCHFSVFDALHDGARLAGETPRGLYRFRISGIRDERVEITEIEEEALSAV